MIRRFLPIMVLALIGGITLCPVITFAQPARVLVVDVKEEIAPPVWHKIKKAKDIAEKDGYTLILLHMNTYGGMLEMADSIRTFCLQSKIPVWVYIDNNAASAGALISIACEKIFMRTGASMGAATVVNQSGEKMPDKYQSYMRSMMRATAEARNRNPDVAEAMVDPLKQVAGVSDSGKVVSLTASEAIRLGYCDGVAGNIDQALRQGGVKEYSVSVLQLSGVDKMISFLIHPIVSGLLILLIIGGIYFEFQSPGAVFPILIAIIAMALYFAPLYLEGLAAHWEILIFLAGLVLIAVEIFVIPGFGVTGISGIFLVITGLTLAMIGNWGFDFTPVGSSKILQSFFIVIISMFVAIVSSIYFSKKLFTSHLFGGLALETVEDSSSGYVASDSAMQQWIGKKGNARSILRPAGKVEIEGEILDAVAETGYIEPGEPVVVVRFENAQLIVRRARGGV